ncbi:type II toxin-antitoxin system RelE/ParE family toxin [Altererythrobacter aquiaggeris]|uniref:type II toxin-antitoxin system RelE family toxin n=1 Tax=Aestuarierythrobacter aquiaggeris TaxID=1898396 RepID=UPI0030170E1B
MPYFGFAFTDRVLDFIEGLPPKIRRQVVKRAKALHTSPFPASAKKLKDVETDEGEPVYRERSGDYRILYIVRSNPSLVLILDIDHRKDVYRMPKTKTDPADDMRMKEKDFDDIMGRALGVPAPLDTAKNDDEPKRLSAHPRKKR